MPGCAVDELDTAAASVSASSRSGRDMRDTRDAWNTRDAQDAQDATPVLEGPWLGRLVAGIGAGSGAENRAAAGAENAAEKRERA